MHGCWLSPKPFQFEVIALPTPDCWMNLAAQLSAFGRDGSMQGRIYELERIRVCLAEEDFAAKFLKPQSLFPLHCTMVPELELARHNGIPPFIVHL